MNQYNNCMEQVIPNKKSYAGLDYVRVIVAFLIVAIHTSPLKSISSEADFIFTRIISRIGVPFFFMVTGFFLLSPLFTDKKSKRDTCWIMQGQKIRNFIQKTAILYGFAILIYLPVNWYSGYFIGKTATSLMKDIFINGTFYHLWYLPAVITGVLLVYLLTFYLSKKSIIIISAFFYGIGLLGDSYYGLVEQIPWLKLSYDLLFQIFDYTRNGIFFAPIYLVLGAIIGSKQEKAIKSYNFNGLIISSALLLVEGLALHHYDLQKHDSMYLFLVLVMYYFFLMILNFNGKSQKKLRTLSMIIYVLHPLAIILVRGGAKVIGLEKLFIDNSLIHYMAVCCVTFIWAILYLYITKLFKKDHPDTYGRAWIEINLSHLRENAKILKSLLPSNCALMAVVKANAYGHGDVNTAKELNKIGISSFAVATLAEAVGLRRNGIKGDILIFGYTHPQDFKYLIKYNLIQTVVDYDYAKSLHDYGHPVRVHVKIDTGMNRLGENYNNLSNLEAIFKLKNLKIEGTFTHLSVSDSILLEDISFTNTQIAHFYDTVREISNLGFDPGKLHIQSSYGLLNYPELECDYARIGIALYGVLSSANDRVKLKANLKPVLSVKARIVMTKNIEKGDTVSYGRTYAASETRNIATVTIGYADGIPRNLKDGYVLVNCETLN